MTRDTAVVICDFPHLPQTDFTLMDEIGSRLRRQVEALTADPRELAEMFEGQLTLGDKLSRTSDLDEVLQLCLDAAVAVDSMDSGGVYLVEEDKLVLKAHTGLSERFVAAVQEYDCGNVRWDLMMAGRPLYFVKGDRRMEALGTVERDPEMMALAIVPIQSGGETIGCFNIASHNVAKFPKFVRVALECITHQLADVVARAVAHDKMKHALYKAQVLADAGYEVILVHRDYDVVAVNNSWTRLTGFTEKDAKRLGLARLFTPETLPIVKAQVEAGVEGEYCAAIKTRDEKEIAVRVKTHEVVYSNGCEVRCRAKVITPLDRYGEVRDP